MSTPTRTSRLITIRRLLLTLAIIAVAGSAYACKVPVFRYALERWNPDKFQVLVLSAGELQPEQLALLDPLTEKSGATGRTELKVIDVAKSNDPAAMELWNKHKDGSSPVVVALYPQTNSIPQDRAAHVGPLTTTTFSGLLTSPVRQQIARQLTSGKSAVWVLIESGDAAKDEAARVALRTQLDKDASWMQLPTAEELEVDAKVLIETKIKLRIDFAVVSVKRDDPQEKFLVDCLLNSEEDLRDFNEPIAFPVFGRGRVLYALVGKGIGPETIRTASTFVAGPCSCQVKNQNPGFDLLLDCDWDEAVGDVLISQPIPGVDSKPTLLTIPPGRAGR